MTHTTASFEHILDDPGVQAVDYEPAADEVRVFVAEKLPEEEVPDELLVAERIDHHATDVIECGDIMPEPSVEPDASADGATEHRANHEPPIGGVSEINASSTAATAGLLATVTDRQAIGQWADSVEAGDRVRLSNAHVYGDATEELGQPILQPSPLDGGSRDDIVGTFTGFVPLDDPYIDAAARTIHSQEANDVLGIAVESVERVRRTDYTALEGETLCKAGRTTGVTTGEVLATNASVRIRYSGETITKRRQLLTTDMSEGGDSGSPVFLGQQSAPTELVGHLFAGSDRVTVINRMADVEARLGVEVSVTTQEHEPEETFEEHVEALVADRYGAENVHRQHRFDDGRYADLIVFADDFLWAMELENDPYSVLNGSGQADHYAMSAMMEWPDRGVAIPVLCVPDGHIDPEERRTTELRGVRVWEVPIPDDVDTEGV